MKKKPDTKEGVVKILFKVEENGFAEKIKITQSDFDNSNLSKCILDKFKNTFFSPPPLGINRYISHDLVFKLEETALKELKEKELLNQPPKVLPVQ